MDTTLPPKKHLLYLFLVCAMVFSAQVIPRWWGDSIVMDEEWNLTASYYYWTHGDVITSFGTTAPGALCGLPLLFMNLKLIPEALFDWRTRSLGLLFMYNPEHLETITVLSRGVDWLIGLAIGFLIYRSVRAGPRPLGIAALVLWTFDPTLLAFSGTAKTDLSVAFWFLLCVLAFKRAQTSARPLPFTWAGALAGLTCASRYNGLLLLPALFALEVMALSAPGFGLQALRRRWPLWLSAVGGFLLSVGLVYLPGTAIRGWQLRLNPWNLFYINMASYFRQRTGISGLPVFFAGRSWSGGTYLNFPYHFFYKNTLPFLILILLALLLLLLKKIRIPLWVWVPPTIYLGLFGVLDRAMDIRHALPTIPLLILAAAYAFQWVWERGTAPSFRWLRVVAASLLVGQGASLAAAFPCHIAYANELMDAHSKYSLMYAYNWNLGQDMKRLAELGRKQGWKRVKLITGQRTDPYFYGLSWHSWTLKDLRQPQPGTVYVIDSSLLTDPAYAKLCYEQGSWLCKWVWQNIGGTLFYYETPGTWDPSSRDDSPIINSFPYYKNGIQPYLSHGPPDSWIEM